MRAHGRRPPAGAADLDEAERSGTQRCPAGSTLSAAIPSWPLAGLMPDKPSIFTDLDMRFAPGSPVSGCATTACRWFAGSWRRRTAGMAGNPPVKTVLSTGRARCRLCPSVLPPFRPACGICRLMPTAGPASAQLNGSILDRIVISLRMVVPVPHYQRRHAIIGNPSVRTGRKTAKQPIHFREVHAIDERAGWLAASGAWRTDTVPSYTPHRAGI